jgi:hypothetical protein
MAQQDWFSQFETKPEPIVPETDWFSQFETKPEPIIPSIEPTEIPEIEPERKLGLRDIAAMGIRGISAFVPGGPAGALAGGLGEALAQTVGGEDYNFPQMGVQAGLGAIPFGRVASIGRGMLKGAALGTAGVTGTELAETGELPSAERLALGAGLGIIGGGIGGRTTRASRRAPDILPSVTKPKMRIRPDGTFQNTETGEIFDKIGNKIETPIDKLVSAIKEAKPLTRKQAEIYKAERLPKFERAREVVVESEESAGKFLGTLGGKHTKVQMTPLKMEQSDVDSLFGIIGKEVPDVPTKAHAITGLNKILNGQVPQDNELRVLSDIFGSSAIGRLRSVLPKVDIKHSKTLEALNLPRAVQAAYDISAPFRQGLGLIHTKAWWTSWDDMLKSYGSEKAYKGVIDSILERPNYQRIRDAEGRMQVSFSEKAGLKLTDLLDLSKREEAIMSTWAEKIPGIRASNRAYTAFLNKLRADNFDSLIKQAEKIHETARIAGKLPIGEIERLNPRKNLLLARELASYVNNASGRGSLGKLERNAVALNTMLFSPRLIASRLQMMNPKNYTRTSPLVRKQYLKSMLGIAGTWTTLATLGKMAGADVSLDANSADFGKIKIGNTRLDPAGGFQQYLVLAKKLAEYGTTLGKGEYAVSTTGERRRYGMGFGARTPGEDIINFIRNKLAPVPSYATSPFFAKEYFPFEAGDRAVRLFTPIMIQDLTELMQEDPELLLGIIPSAVGLGVQQYGERGEQQRILPESIFPREADIRFPAR